MSGVRLLFTFFFACCLAVVARGQASAQEQAVLERDAALLTEPRNGAPVVAQLKQGTCAEVIARKGAWVNLRTASGAGWMFSFNMRLYAVGAARKPRLSERQSLPWRFGVIDTASLNAVAARRLHPGHPRFLRCGR